MDLKRLEQRALDLQLHGNVKVKHNPNTLMALKVIRNIQIKPKIYTNGL